MPEKLRFEPADILLGKDFTFRENKEMNAAQANETFVVEAKSNRTLGKGGEVLGFAKKQFSNNPEVNAVRTQAYQEALEVYEKTSKRTAVKQWLADRQDMQFPDAMIQGAPARVNQARSALEELQKSDADEKELKAARELLVKEEKRAALLPQIQQNPELEKRRLWEVAQKVPEVRAYIEAKERLKAAENLNTCNDAIAESSSHLFENGQNMVTPDLGGDRQLLTRAVASYAVDQAIGLQVCAQEKFGVDEDGGLIGISIQCDGVGVKSSSSKNGYGETVTASFLDINYAAPLVQKGLYDLEALDYITGQTDRHAGNIFVDPITGKVTGIDNDLAFPAVDREVMIVNGLKLLEAKVVAGIPRMMHQETAAKIQKMEPDALRAALKAVRPPDGSKGLGSKEIEGAVKRLIDLKVAIAKVQAGSSVMEIVPVFTPETYQRALKRQQDVSQEGSQKLTSYIGTVENLRAECQQLDNKICETHSVIQFTGEHKAKLNPEYVTYQKMDSARQEDYRGLQRVLDRLDGSLESTKKQRNKLDDPKLKDRLAALRHGGVERRKQQLNQKISQLTSEQESVKRQVAEFLNEQKVSLADRVQQSKEEQAHQEPKQHVGDVLHIQRATKNHAADQHSAGDHKVGDEIAKRPTIKVGSTSSSTLHH